MAAQLPGCNTQVYTMHEALVAAGSADSDNPFIQDSMLTDWISGRTFRCIHSKSELESCKQDGIEIVIFKENQQ
jgi:hypothetical protein